MFEKIQKLRAATQAPMKNCKKALEQTNGDIPSAIKILQEEGIAKFAKYSHNDTPEGGVAVFENNDAVAVVQIGCRTDFTAKSDGMKEIYNEVEKHVFNVKNIEELQKATEMLVKNISVSNAENIVLKKMQVFEKTSSNFPTFYIHNPHFTNFGRILALVALSEDKKDVAKEITLHIASKKPRFLSEESIPADVLKEEEENNIKLAEGNEKKLMGLMNKFKKENCLMSQKFILDESQKISSMIGSSKINAFLVWYVG